jgi:hypothetical protein
MYLGASFFTKGIVCDANNSPGILSFAWNEIQLKSMQSNLDAFVIRNTNNGWANVIVLSVVNLDLLPDCSTQIPLPAEEHL